MRYELCNVMDLGQLLCTNRYHVWNSLRFKRRKTVYIEQVVYPVISLHMRQGITGS